MKERQIILSEELFDEALRFVAMGAAGILNPKELPLIQEKFAPEIWQRLYSSALAAGIIRKQEENRREQIMSVLDELLKLIESKTPKE